MLESVFIVFFPPISLLASFVLPFRQVVPRFLPTESGFSLSPSHPLRAMLGEVLTLGNKTLMNRAGEQRN